MKEINSNLGKDARPAAVVTGAARGIGRAIAMELSRQGYDIAAIDVAWADGGSADLQQSLAKEMPGHGGQVIALHGDIADLDAQDKLVESIIKNLGRIDVLVNNAGVAPLQRCDILGMTSQSFDRVLAVNLRGAFFFAQRVANCMLRGRGALALYRPCIIFITSVSAETSSVNRADYCISKSGLSMAARLFADRLAGEGILVFEVRPGIILTSMTAPVKEKYGRLIGEGLVPQKRWGYPEDVAKAVAALAGGAFAFSTGAVIEVSGGMNIRRL